MGFFSDTWVEARTTNSKYYKWLDKYYKELDYNKKLYSKYNKGELDLPYNFENELDVWLADAEVFLGVYGYYTPSGLFTLMNNLRGHRNNFVNLKDIAKHMGYALSYYYYDTDLYKDVFYKLFIYSYILDYVKKLESTSSVSDYLLKNNKWYCSKETQVKLINYLFKDCIYDKIQLEDIIDLVVNVCDTRFVDNLFRIPKVVYKVYTNVLEAVKLIDPAITVVDNVECKTLTKEAYETSYLTEFIYDKVTTLSNILNKYDSDKYNSIGIYYPKELDIGYIVRHPIYNKDRVLEQYNLIIYSPSYQTRKANDSKISYAKAIVEELFVIYSYYIEESGYKYTHIFIEEKHDVLDLVIDLYNAKILEYGYNFKYNLLIAIYKLDYKSNHTLPQFSFPNTDMLLDFYTLPGGKNGSKEYRLTKKSKSLLEESKQDKEYYNELNAVYKIDTVKEEDINPSKTKNKDLPEYYNMDLINILNYTPQELVDGVRRVVEHKDFKTLTMLFHGPSGTGKTNLAGYIVNQLGYKLKTIAYSELVSKYVGETEANISSLLRETDNKTIILIDEADTLISSRDDSELSHHGRSTTNEWLIQLERFNGVLIITTNFKDSLDKALYRRINIKVEFGTLQPDKFNLAIQPIITKYNLEQDITVDKNTNGLKGLCLGDIGNVENNIIFYGITKVSEFVSRLRKEIEFRQGKRTYL